MDKSSEREAKEHVRGSEFHALKTVQPDYSEILAGRAFDTRENDRDFRVGDTILFREFDSRHQEYTGEQTKRQITSVMTTDDRYGALNPDFVLLGLS
jgi:hypothetical protein